MSDEREANISATYAAQFRADTPDGERVLARADMRVRVGVGKTGRLGFENMFMAGMIMAKLMCRK